MHRRPPGVPDYRGSTAADIALDPYSDQGHDGIVLDGKIADDRVDVNVASTRVARCPRWLPIVNALWCYARHARMA